MQPFTVLRILRSSKPVGLIKYFDEPSDSAADLQAALEHQAGAAGPDGEDGNGATCAQYAPAAAAATITVAFQVVAETAQLTVISANNLLAAQSVV
jgi:hypothetical protein